MSSKPQLDNITSDLIAEVIGHTKALHDLYKRVADGRYNNATLRAIDAARDAVVSAVLDAEEVGTTEQKPDKRAGIYNPNNPPLDGKPAGLASDVHDPTPEELNAEAQAEKTGNAIMFDLKQVGEIATRAAAKARKEALAQRAADEPMSPDEFLARVEQLRTHVRERAQVLMGLPTDPMENINAKFQERFAKINQCLSAMQYVHEMFDDVTKGLAWIEGELRGESIKPPPGASVDFGYAKGTK